MMSSGCAGERSADGVRGASTGPVFSSLPRTAPRAGGGEAVPSDVSPAGCTHAAERCTVRTGFDDEYTGEVILERGVPVPHGRGTLVSRSGRHSYAGDFSHQRRDGYGKLVTERYVLQGRWRMNQLDTESSCRVDYPSGDKYCGYLEMRPVAPAAGSSTPDRSDSSHGHPRMSKFSTWVQQCAPVRVGWGEMVAASGDRFFGEWVDDQPHGFGCLLARSGDRYVGRFRRSKFHDTGALFCYAGGSDGAAVLAEGIAFATAGTSTAAGSTAAPGLWPRNGSCCVYDGVWAEGKFAGDGHVTLPSGTRVSGDWRGATRPSSGEVVFTARGRGARDPSGPWRECFHWESLLCGVHDEAYTKEKESCADLRERLGQAVATGTTDSARAVIQDFLNHNTQLRTALRVFCRCFFFCYGTCGSSAELGAGQGGSALGWCYSRDALGGCVHPCRGRPIAPSDLLAALTDIFSLSRSALRWTADMLGEDSLQRVEQVQSSVSMMVGRWVADAVFKEVHEVLLNLYSHVYAVEELEMEKALERMRGRVTLDDIGVDFARRHGEERLFDPYADAVHCIEQLGRARHTLSTKLAVLTQWSRDIDLSTRLALTSASAAPGAAPLKQADGSASRRAYQSGSADDLLPIHQYVLSQSRVPHLYAHARMLMDFAEEAMFVDATSQESFCLTNLQVCVLTLPKLNGGLRDSNRVLVPATLFAERVLTVLRDLPRFAESSWEEVRVRGTAVGGDELLASAADLEAMLRGYLASWVPDVLALLAAAPRPLPTLIRLCPNAGSLVPHALAETALLAALERLDDDVTAGARRLCWTAADSLFRAMQIGCGYTSVESAGPGAAATPCPLTDGLAMDRSKVVVGLLVPVHTLPSYLLLMHNIVSSEL